MTKVVEYRLKVFYYPECETRTPYIEREVHIYIKTPTPSLTKRINIPAPSLTKRINIITNKRLQQMDIIT